VSFWWKVSSQTNNDFLQFRIGNTVVTNISGEVPWRFQSFNIGPSNAVLEWRYTKNSSTTVGQDRGWVDQVKVGQLPPTITSQPASQAVGEGSTVTLRVTAAGTAPLNYQWRFNSNNLSDDSFVRGATTATLVLSNAQPAHSGFYSVLVSNSEGSMTSSNALLTVRQVPTLAEALDGPGLTWVTGGTGSPWIGQLAVTQDREDAAESGPAAASQYTYIKTTVIGPGTLTFWWSVSSERDHDFLRFMVNTVDQIRISGEEPWQRQTYNVQNGPQELQWRFSHNSTTAAGLDRAWVDQVLFVPNAAPDVPINAQIRSSSAKMILTWEAQSGRTYQVLFKNSLEETNWQVLAAEVVATDSVATVEDVVGAQPQRFYRIMEQ
jgi:hypothetical protein